tara:strand:+ start:185 stop:403 length:219 start_codon:yes stop_codon:yes gene_type:complete
MSFVYDSEMLKAIEDLLTTADRYDLVEYLRYLEETLTSLDDCSSEEESEEYNEVAEELYDVGMTHDGFYFLK